MRRAAVLSCAYVAAIAIPLAAIGEWEITGVYFWGVGLGGAFVLGLVTGRWWTSALPLLATLTGVLIGHAANPACHGCGNVGWGTVAPEFAVYWALPMTFLSIMVVLINWIVKLSPRRDSTA